MKKRGKDLARWLAPAGWYGVIWAFSAQAGEASQEVSDGVLTHLFGIDLSALDWNVMLLLSFLVRKGAHMAVYFVLTGLLLWALAPWLAGKRPWPWTALGLCGVLAAGDELHQFFVPGRSCRLRDVGIDLLGGACFLLCRWGISALLRRRDKRPCQPGPKGL